MGKILIVLIILCIGSGCKNDKTEIWVFILAGQSNMAGRGVVEHQDTVTNDRVLTINSIDSLILAQEPIHFYEPNLAGLDCGLSFGKKLVANIPEDISILLIPTAVGGSSITKWLNDENHRMVDLLTNFKRKVALGKKHGIIKGVLWHQGESDANTMGISEYKENLEQLFSKFRNIIADQNLPIIVGELGSFSEKDEEWQEINRIIHDYAKTDTNTYVISTSDLEDKGDRVHFNSEGQRNMGARFANKILELKQINK